MSVDIQSVLDIKLIYLIFADKWPVRKWDVTGTSDPQNRNVFSHSLALSFCRVSAPVTREHDGPWKAKRGSGYFTCFPYLNLFLAPHMFAPHMFSAADRYIQRQDKRSQITHSKVW